MGEVNYRKDIQISVFTRGQQEEVTSLKWDIILQEGVSRPQICNKWQNSEQENELHVDTWSRISLSLIQSLSVFQINIGPSINEIN